ncbi:hypothetical protein [Pseudogemmobacter sonorensis]|uniref:hypothetical protein n=1 Tax=Pseudogemmobacter sonorensis TaxID=2989681 RepID=UPI003690D687
MRGFMVIAGVIFGFVPVLGYLVFDYTMQNRWARAQGDAAISFTSYIGAWIDLARGDEDTGPPKGLAAMLPKAPEGWTTRDVLPPDHAAIGAADLPEAARRLALDAYEDGRVRGAAFARKVYEAPSGPIAVELTRYPNSIFTSFMAMAAKLEVEMAADAIGGRDFMTVRGFDLYEAPMPGGAPVRVFHGHMNAQMNLRVTAPATAPNAEIVELMSRLHVPAMNADLARPIPGMGEVPVIVLAGELGVEGLRRRAAERAAAAAAEREAERLREEAAAEPEAEVEADPLGEDLPAFSGPSATAPAAPEVETAPEVEAERAVREEPAPEEEGPVAPARPGLLKTEGGTGGFGGDCRIENGRKLCGLSGN